MRKNMKLKKYIIFSNDTGIIFPLSQSHCDVAMTIPHKPISAGFVTQEEGKFQCYGQSITLGLKSRDCDSDFFIKNKITESGTHIGLKRKGSVKGARN